MRLNCNNKYLRSVYLSILILLMASCTEHQEVIPAEADITAELRARADSAAAAMSVRELAGQVVMPATYTVTDAATMKQLRRYITTTKVGGLVFLKGDTASMHAIADTLQRLSRFPLFMAIDAEWGLGMRFTDGGTHPHFSRLTGSTQQQMYDYGNRVALEASHLGLNMILGPVLDVAPVGSVMADRSLGGNARRVAQLGTAYARGLEDGGVISVAKHFPGHGATAIDSHLAMPILDRTARQMEENDLLPFRDYIHLGFPAIMAGHIAVPSLTGDSVPAVLSHSLLTDLLRGKMGFKGLIITDAVNMEALRGQAPNEPEAVVASLLAGADIIIAPQDTKHTVNTIIEATKDGRLPLAELRRRVAHILFYKYLLQ